MLLCCCHNISILAKILLLGIGYWALNGAHCLEGLGILNPEVPLGLTLLGCDFIHHVIRNIGKDGFKRPKLSSHLSETHLLSGLHLGLESLEEAVHDDCSGGAVLHVDPVTLQRDLDVSVLVELSPVTDRSGEGRWLCEDLIYDKY